MLDHVRSSGGQVVIQPQIVVRERGPAGRRQGPANAVNGRPDVSAHADARPAARPAIRVSQRAAPTATLYRPATATRPAEPIRRRSSGSAASVRIASTQSSVVDARNPVTPCCTISVWTPT